MGILNGDKIFIDGPVEISGDASISGTLTANRIESSTIDNLRNRIAELVDSYEPATASAASVDSIKYLVDSELNELLTTKYELLDTATAAANLDSLNANSGFFADYLAVLGQATITNLTVNQQLSLSKIAGLNGTVDLAGNLNISGDVHILGTLTAPIASFSSLLAQRIEAEEIKTSQLIIAADNSTSEVGTSFTSEVSTTSASIATNATAGKATLPAGLTEYTIYTPRVDATSLIYVTPTGDSQNQVLYVKAKKENEFFKVAINQPLPFDLDFNWWIIKLE